MTNRGSANWHLPLLIVLTLFGALAGDFFGSLLAHAYFGKFSPLPEQGRNVPQMDADEGYRFAFVALGVAFGACVGLAASAAIRRLARK